jgi:hypothetical protein
MNIIEKRRIIEAPQIEVLLHAGNMPLLGI